jgi:hypothetical protein
LRAPGNLACGMVCDNLGRGKREVLQI